MEVYWQQCKAIADFHVDSFLWGAFMHCLFGTKVIVCFPVPMKIGGF
jgi:hypothetical protein